MSAKNVSPVQMLVAATVAVVLTYASSWSFLDSTKVARWVTAADVVSTVVATAPHGTTAPRSLRASLLQ